MRTAAVIWALLCGLSAPWSLRPWGAQDSAAGSDTRMRSGVGDALRGLTNVGPDDTRQCENPVNFAEDAPITCSCLGNCGNVNDGNRYTSGRTVASCHTIATVDIIIPEDAYVYQLYWKVAGVILWGNSYGKLKVQEENGSWTELRSVFLGLSVHQETVPLNPPRRIIKAQIWADRGTDPFFWNCYDFYELEAWGCLPEGVPGPPPDWSYGDVLWVAFGADPVNTATGNFTHEEVDLSFAGRPTPFVFSRYYNSQDRKAGPLGPGWTHSFNIALTQSGSTDTVSVRWGDGRTDYWKDVGSDDYRPLYPGLYDELVKNPGGTWTVTRKSLDVYEFNGSGELTRILDKNGDAYTLDYSGGNLTSVTDPAGRSITMSYTAGNLLERVTDFASAPRSVQYAYSGGHLEQVTDVLGNSVSYGYSDSMWLSTIVDERGDTTVVNVYDAEGRVVRQRDGNGAWTAFSYDDPEENQTTVMGFVSLAGRGDTLETIHVYSDTFCVLLYVVNALGDTLSYEYDENNNRTLVKDRNGNVTVFGYDARGNVTTTTEADGGVTTLGYGDPSFPDVPTTKTNALGYVTKWTYDSSANVLIETRWLNQAGTDSVIRGWTYNEAGQHVTETDERGYVHQWTYGAEGLLMEEIDREGNRTWYGYDDLCRRIWVTDGRGSGPEDPAHTTRYTYDNADRIVRIEGPPVGSAPHAIVQTFGYDEIGNRTMVVDGRGDTTRYVYDGNSNLIQITEPLGRVTLHVYDELNRRIYTIDAQGDTTTFGYDDADRLLETRDAEGNVWSYTYDRHGNVLTETDPSGVTLTYEYDALNRRVAARDELGNEWSYEYDKVGNVTSQTDPTGKRTECIYDALNRLVSVSDAEGAVTEYAYDGAGNLVGVRDAKGDWVTNREYDALNRILRSTDANGNVVQYGYDDVGNLSWEEDANGRRTDYTYDAANRLVRVDYEDATFVTYTYDDNGNRTGMTDATGVSTFSYDALNRLRTSTDGFGRQVKYDYDLVGNRTKLTYPDLKEVTYAYDGANRLTGMTDWAGRTVAYGYDGLRLASTTFPNGAGETRSYDEAGRLDSLGTRDPGRSILLSFAWVRDGIGNPTSVAESGCLAPSLGGQSLVNYVYDADNRLLMSSEGTYTHDANGNLVSRTVGEVTTTFAYDAENRLVSQITGASTVGHMYDGQGYRVARVENGAETRYVLDRGRSMSHVLCETDSTGAITTYYLHGRQLMGKIDAATGTAHYYHTNDMGTVVALTDSLGQVTDCYAYTPYGVPAGREGTTANPFTYVGALGVMAEADGLYFMRARFYDPETGRFVSKDPVEGRLTDPLDLHRYSYVGGRPVLASDPTGLIDWGKILLGGAIVALAVAGAVFTGGTSLVALGLVGSMSWSAGETIMSGILDSDVEAHSLFGRAAWFGARGAGADLETQEMAASVIEIGEAAFGMGYSLGTAARAVPRDVDALRRLSQMGRAVVPKMHSSGVWAPSWYGGQYARWCVPGNILAQRIWNATRVEYNVADVIYSVLELGHGSASLRQWLSLMQTDPELRSSLAK